MRAAMHADVFDPHRSMHFAWRTVPTSDDGISAFNAAATNG